MKIEYLDREEIDTGRWDELISQSPNETLYPYSWYLDAAAEHWSALVMDRYRFVMPVAWKRKFGIRYLYQPVYCQQLGVYGAEVTEPFIINQFLESLGNRFRAGVYHFNAGNPLEKTGGMVLEERTNHTLSLHRKYEDLSAQYTTNAKRNLKRSYESVKVVEKRIHLEDLIELKMKSDPVSKPDRIYTQIGVQLRKVMETGKAQIYGVRGERGLDAAAFIAYSKTRILYLLSVSNQAGKDRRAMFRIVDELIRDHSGSEMVLDFEGSSIPSIARFFSGFGAVPETYREIRLNSLPFNLIQGRKYGR